ncbi:ribosome maturation factor RimP [Propionicicella superfundia]|uniref:ribosome maturation factor RimP n=1 Tax=Propionicicella superfundia TaxID=348582 RepID=UPI0004128541|nr:ribosome maturation factor RimP [Propionicicella superfundia]
MNEQSLRRILEPILASAGLELEAVEIVSAGRRSLVRVVVDGDGANGRGPTLDEIAEASKALSAALDDAPEAGSRPYTLEVSTRGVGRPLTRPEHWRRNAGRLVTVRFSDERAPVTARIADTTATGATLTLDARTITVDFADVTRALIQVELNRPAAFDDQDQPEEE